MYVILHSSVYMGNADLWYIPQPPTLCCPLMHVHGETCSLSAGLQAAFNYRSNIHFLPSKHPLMRPSPLQCLPSHTYTHPRPSAPSALIESAHMGILIARSPQLWQAPFLPPRLSCLIPSLPRYILSKVYDLRANCLWMYTSAPSITSGVSTLLSMFLSIGMPYRW